ncbi:MAG: extracellular solute-binding protein [Chloroflexi bacterium]|nr:extracellular solute-binding protein [Chloroflexota bacterium]
MSRLMVKVSILVALVILVGIACSRSATPVSITTPGDKGPIQIGKLSREQEWDKLVVAAKKEGSVMVYHTSIGEAREASARVFKEKYGIAIDYLAGRGPELVERLIKERQVGLYAVDAKLTGLTTFFNSISPLKITIPLEPLLVLPEVTDGTKWRTGNVPFIDKDRTTIAFSLTRYSYVTINTDMVKEGEFTSYEDLLNPKWKGKIVMNDPTLSQGVGWFTFIMLQAYGREKGEDFMGKLAKQEPMIIRDQRLQAEWVARGKYPVAIATEISARDAMIKAGAPIKPLAMKEGQATGSGPMNLMVFDRAPHPNAAKLFTNWVLSWEGGEIMSKHSGYLSARADVSTEGFDPIFVPGPKDGLPIEEYKLQEGNMTKLGAAIFKDLLPK